MKLLLFDGRIWLNSSAPNLWVPGANQNVVPSGLLATSSSRRCCGVTVTAPCGAVAGPFNASVSQRGVGCAAPGEAGWEGLGAGVDGAGGASGCGRAPLNVTPMITAAITATTPTNTIATRAGRPNLAIFGPFAGDRRLRVRLPGRGSAAAGGGSSAGVVPARLCGRPAGQ